jgi:hypothetical protein
MLHADEVITFFMKPYPIVADSEHAQYISNKLRQPGAIDRYMLHGITKKDITSGIFSTYRGWLGLSNSNGQTTFPRKQEITTLYYLIADHITPNIITGNTIHHWELEPDTPAIMYQIEQQKDRFAGIAYWETSQVDIPEDRVIPEQAIVIFARPKDIYVPLGASLVREDKPNLVLPDIYVKKGINIESSTLYVLNIRQFFSPVTIQEKPRDNGYSTIVIPHPGYIQK